MPAVARFDLTRRSRNADYRIVQGATYSLTLRFPTWTAMDWSGFAGRGQLRAGPRNRNPAVVADVTVRIVDPIAKTVHLSINHSTTETIRQRRGTVDIELFNGTVVHRLLQGEWELSEETTQ